jgi:hypothetical protein
MTISAAAADSFMLSGYSFLNIYQI